jgi:hypothetical protein
MAKANVHQFPVKIQRQPLTREDAALVKGMLQRGDIQSEIAAYFGGANSGRISEINTGQRFADVKPAPLSALPPPGPYPIGRSGLRARQTLEALGELIKQALKDIETYEGLS